MIKCEQCLECLSAYVDGELPEDEMKELDIHLNECSACSKELELLKAIVSVCQDLTEELPESFETSLHKRLEEAKEDLQVKKGKVFNLRLISQIAAGFILVITLGVFIRLDLGKVSKNQAAEDSAEKLKIADMNTSLAMSSRNGDGARSAPQSPSVTIAGAQGLNKLDEETKEATENKASYSLLFTEREDISYQRVEGQDTQVRIEVKDISGAIKSIMIIEEKISGNSDENKNNLQEMMTDFGGTQEGLVQMELYYPNDEIWHTFLSELQIVFPNMVIESVPAADERERIRIILSNSRD